MLESIRALNPFQKISFTRAQLPNRMTLLFGAVIAAGLVVGGVVLYRWMFAKKTPFEFGLEASRQGNYAEAIKYFDAIPRSTASARVFLEKGKAQIQLEHYDLALQNFDHALAKNTAEYKSELYLNKGHAFLGIGDAVEALHFYESAKSHTNPLNVKIEILLGQARAYIERGDFSAAREKSDEAIKLCQGAAHPLQLAQAFLLMGRSYIAEKKSDQAKFSCDSASKILEKVKNPELESELLLLKADVAQAYQHYDLAIDARIEAIRGMRRKNRGQTYLKIASDCMRHNRLKEAYFYYTLALKYFDQNQALQAITFFNRGICCYRLNSTTDKKTHAIEPKIGPRVMIRDDGMEEPQEFYERRIILPEKPLDQALADFKNAKALLPKEAYDATLLPLLENAPAALQSSTAYTLLDVFMVIDQRINAAIDALEKELQKRLLNPSPV